MRRLAAWLLLTLMTLPAFAQAPARTYNQPELDALLAPVALYPDALLSHILVAATYPEDLREAADWSRANGHLSGQQAVEAAEPMPWHPSVKALVATPELLARMDESPQWTADLAAAFVNQEPYVMDTVQALRRRAQASGHLESTPEYQVQRQGHAIAVYPAHPHVVYVRYYDPYVVYGPWWWHSYRPVYWRPWYARPAVHVSSGFFRGSVDWHRRHVHRVTHHHHHHHRPQRHPTVHNHVHQMPAPRQHNHVHPAQHARPIVDTVRQMHTPSHSPRSVPAQQRQRGTGPPQRQQEARHGYRRG